MKQRFPSNYPEAIEAMHRDRRAAESLIGAYTFKVVGYVHGDCDQESVFHIDSVNK